MSISTRGTYGADGTEYRTEVESFSKVVSRGTAGTGPAWFEVRTKTGQIMEFGNTADSRILAQGKTTARSWAVNKVSDTKGNYYTVSYVNDAVNGEAYPSRLDYTGNAAASLTPYNSVRFVYTSARPDASTGYHAGSMVKSTVRMSQVQTYAGSALVADYRLAYQQGTATGRSQLISVTLCDGAGICLPPTSFTWQNGGAGTLSFSQYNDPITPGYINDGTLLSGDWNGDGRLDVLWYESSTGRNRWYTHIGFPNGSLSFDPQSGVIPEGNINNGVLFAGDWNGDGFTDLMWYRSSSGDNRWYMNNRSTTAAPSFTEYVAPIFPGAINGGTLHFGDWNGDGRTDVLWYESSTGRNRWFHNLGTDTGTLVFSPYSAPIPQGDINIGILHVGDWDGDGLTDLMWFRSTSGDNRWYVNRSNGLNTLSFTSYVAPIAAGDLNNGNLHFGDWNGDGVTDVLWYRPSAGLNNWYVNKGVSASSIAFSKYSDPIASADINNGDLHLGDWNGDGGTDVMWFRSESGDNSWYTNKGIVGTTLTLTPQIAAIAPTAINNGSLLIGDWDGTGTMEALWYRSSSGWNIWFQNNEAIPDLMTAAASGLGAAVSITYKPCTDGTTYTKDSTAGYPLVDLQGPMQVVNRVNHSNGIGGESSSTYTYAGGKAHLDGRGFLGFRQVKTTDLQTNLSQTTTYRQDFPFIGLVATEVKALNAVTLSSVANSYNATDLGGTRRKVFLSQSQVTATDLDGTALPSVTSTFQYDAHGNATQITATHSDGYSKSTTNTYSNDAANWLLGRLTGRQ